ncbi:MAG: PQQ-binding-like beta-propeller repeat protein [Limisphaerales bacterium]
MKSLIAILLFAGFAAHSVPASDWPRWRGPNDDGVSTETGWLARWPVGGPKVLWKASVGGGFSSVSISQGRLYTMGNRNEVDTVYCLDANAGAEVWRHSYPAPMGPHYYEGGPSVTPTADGDSVYTLSKNGELFCLAAATGKIVWHKNLPRDLGVRIPEWGFAGSPLVEGNALILNAGSYGAALNKATGATLWLTGRDAAAYGSPVVFDDGARRCVAIFALKAVVAVDPKNGQALWRFPWVTSYDVNVADPIIAGDKVFLSSGYNKGCGLIQFGGGQARLVWENKEMRNHFNNCVLFNGYVYGIDGDAGDNLGALKCLELQTGRVKWTEPVRGVGTLTIADGKLIVLAGQGELIVADASPTGFHAQDRAQVLGGKCWTAPVLANGRIYCRNAQGTLICLDVK